MKEEVVRPHEIYPQDHSVAFYHSKISQSQSKSKVWKNELYFSMVEEIIIITKGQEYLNRRNFVAIFVNNLPLNQLGDCIREENYDR